MVVGVGVHFFKCEAMQLGVFGSLAFVKVVCKVVVMFVGMGVVVGLHCVWV